MYDLSRAARSAVADTFAGWAVAAALCDDPRFRESVERVAQGAAIDGEARHYCPRAGRGRKAVRALIERCLAAIDELPTYAAPGQQLARERAFALAAAQVGGCSWWEDAPAGPRRNRFGEARRGAALLCRYAAGVCMADNCVTPVRRPDLWCHAHHPSVLAREATRQVQRAMRAATDALADVLL